MTRPGLTPLVLALSLAFTGQAQAQNFFERLFGLTPSRPQAPPVYNYPNGGPPLPQDGTGEEPVRRAPAAPPTPRPIAIRAPSEDAILGRDLKLNGSNGSLKLERTPGGDMRLRLSLAGRRSAQSVETCTVNASGGTSLPLVSLGRPEGVPRYQLADTSCPLQLDVLDEAVLVKGPGEACVFQAASCQADPGGMWGPDPAQLVGRARDYEQTRGSADKAVRENYKVLTQRAKPESVRPIVAEQAAFSADRETVCRSYAREGTTSFCNAKYSEFRALALGVRLGITTTGSTQSAEARSRRRPGPPDPYTLPSTDELMQRRQPPADDDD